MSSQAQVTPSMTKLAAAAAVLVALISGAGVEAYAFGPAPSSRRVSRRYTPASIKGKGIHKCRDDGSAVTLYLFPTPPSVSAASHRRQRRSKPQTSLPAMSASVLADSDTLPSFQTAHGLLSPEVVMRIADANDLEADGALHKFLRTYKRRGPMACLPMLSDPEILPELTRAMRDIA